MLGLRLTLARFRIVSLDLCVLFTKPSWNNYILDLLIPDMSSDEFRTIIHELNAIPGVSKGCAILVSMLFALGFFVIFLTLPVVVIQYGMGILSMAVLCGCLIFAPALLFWLIVHYKNRLDAYDTAVNNYLFVLNGYNCFLCFYNIC